MKIMEAGENYLETILIEKNRLGRVRSIDICNALGYSKPTVSVAMKHFREGGYIEMDDDGYISLTGSGAAIAERIYERHEVIAGFLMAIGVSRDTAYEDSCKLEHDLSDESFGRMKEYLGKR